MLALGLPLLAGCSRGGYSGGGSDAAVHDAQGTPHDASMADLVASNVDGAADLRLPADLSAPPDLAARLDFAVSPDMAGGSITGGPCMSGSSGATALRVHWTNSGGRASVSYDVHGLPDKSRGKVSVYGYVIPFTPQYVDPFLGPGGVQLDSSSFIDIEISTLGVHSIANISLALFGRSMGTSGSFYWITRTGGDSTALNSVSNGTPYKWYPGDATADIDPGDGGILMRVKAGGNSNSLVVNSLELCMDAR